MLDLELWFLGLDIGVKVMFSEAEKPCSLCFLVAFTSLGSLRQLWDLDLIHNSLCPPVLSPILIWSNPVTKPGNRDRSPVQLVVSRPHTDLQKGSESLTIQPHQDTKSITIS